MQQRLIVLYGPPATGKTSMARQISQSLSLPLISRDLLKKGIADVSAVDTDEQRFAVGQRAYRLFYELLAATLRAGSSVVVESAFNGAVAQAELEPLVGGVDTYLVRCWAHPQTVINRYAARVTCGESHPCHPDESIMTAMRNPDYDWSKYELRLDGAHRIDVFENDLSAETVVGRLAVPGVKYT